MQGPKPSVQWMRSPKLTGLGQKLGKDITIPGSPWCTVYSHVNVDSWAIHSLGFKITIPIRKGAYSPKSSTDSKAPRPLVQECALIYSGTVDDVDPALP